MFQLFLLLIPRRTGIRLGEILAFKWGNINWQTSVILVEKSWRNNVLSDTKTGKSRHVDMSKQLMMELKELLHQRKVEAVKKGLSQPINIIFHDKNGTHLSQNSVRNIWKRMLSKAGLFHNKFHITGHYVESGIMGSVV